MEWNGSDVKVNSMNSDINSSYNISCDVRIDNNE